MSGFILRETSSEESLACGRDEGKQQSHSSEPSSHSIFNTSCCRVHTYSGGHLTDPQNNCVDPLDGDQIKKDIRESAFSRQFPSLDTIFHTLVNYDCFVFVVAIKFYIDVTFRLANS